MKKILIPVFLTILIAPSVLAAGLVPCGGGSPEPPCQICHFFVMTQGIINFVLFTIVPPLAVLMIVIGGGMFILGSSDPKLITQGKSVIRSVAIGLLIIYGSWVFVSTFFALIGVASWTGLLTTSTSGWWKINCGP